MSACQSVLRPYRLLMKCKGAAARAVAQVESLSYFGWMNSFSAKPYTLSTRLPMNNWIELLVAITIMTHPMLLISSTLLDSSHKLAPLAHIPPYTLLKVRIPLEDHKKEIVLNFWHWCNLSLWVILACVQKQNLANSLCFRNRRVKRHHLRDPLELSVVRKSCAPLVSEVCIYYSEGTRTHVGSWANTWVLLWGK